MEGTWDYVSSRWLAQRRDSKWFKKDQGYIERLNEHLAGLAVADITQAKVTQVRDALSATRAAGTVNRIMGVLRAILIQSRDDLQIVSSVPRVRRERETERVRFIDPDEADRLIECLPTHIRPIVKIALTTGLRQFNILNLEWSEVSLNRKWLAIPGNKMKNGDAFGAPLNSLAVQILVKQKGKHPRWVFPVKYAGEYGPLSGIDSAMWHKACAKAGIEDFTFHDLRHTWASWHLQNGTHPMALRELGGWKDDAMVKRYAHLAGSHLAVAAENIGTAWDNSSPGATSQKPSRSVRNKRAA